MLPKTPSTLQGMRELYTYTLLSKLTGGVSVFRAGIVMIDVTSQCMLMIRQKEAQVGEKTIHARWGFPKGAAARGETGPLSTACRELLEETGVDILACAGARLSPSIEVILRPEFSKSEAIVFFFVLVETRPVVVPDGVEIDAVEWVPVRGPYPNRVTATTRLLLRDIATIDVSRPTRTIKLHP